MHGAKLVRSRFLEVVRELHDEDAVLGHQTDQRNQPDLTVNIERRQLQEGEQQRAGNGQRYRPGEDDERIAEALELGRQDQVNQDRREQEHAEEPAALRPKLARLAGVVDGETLRQDCPSLVLQEPSAPDRAEPAGGITPWIRTAFSC